MLEKLKEKAKNLYAFSKNTKYLNIANMLESDDCFFNLDMDTSINILLDLGFTKEEAKKIYVKLINKENMEDYYEIS